jgi:hypothetical protein
LDPNHPPEPPPPPTGDTWYASPDGGAPENGDRRDGPAWEQRQSLGILNAAVQTVRQVLFNPDETFARAKRTGGLTSPFTFVFLMNFAFGLVTIAIETQTGSTYQRVIEGIAARGATEETVETPEVRSFSIPQALGMLIVQSTITPFIQALILHVSLMLFGAARGDYETTYRVCAYASGSLAVLAIVPFCGPFIGLIWQIVVLIIGFSRMHEASTGKATAAVLTPFILFACCCAGVVGSVFGLASLPNSQ